MITSEFPTLCADDVAAVAAFYVELLDFTVLFDSGWYVQLDGSSGTNAQIGVVERTHDSVPAAHRARPAGVLVAVEVDDVDAVHARAVAAALPMALGLRSEDFGQRHFMVVDPGGTLVDVITPIPPTGAFADADDGASVS